MGEQKHTRELLEAAEAVLAGLHARIDAAAQAGEPVPVFSGIVALHDAINSTRAALLKAEGQSNAR